MRRVVKLPGNILQHYYPQYKQIKLDKTKMMRLIVLNKTKPFMVIMRFIMWLLFVLEFKIMKSNEAKLPMIFPPFPKRLITLDKVENHNTNSKKF